MFVGFENANIKTHENNQVTSETTLKDLVTVDHHQHRQLE